MIPKAKTERGGASCQPLQIDQIAEGDALELMASVPTESVDLVLTDPPYNINLAPQRGTFEAIQGDNMSPEEFSSFLEAIFSECYRALKPDTILISFMGWQTIPIFERALTAAGFSIKSMPIWVKNNFGIGYYTRPQYEPLYLCFKGTPPTPETPISDVLQYSKVAKQVHSCQKPVPLISKLIATFSPEGGLVLDPFMGSGTTAVAAINTSRHFLGFEIDPQHLKGARERVAGEAAQYRLF